MKKKVIICFATVFTAFIVSLIAGMSKTVSVNANPTTIVQNRMTSSFSEEQNYVTDIQDRLNCYGYALQVYSLSLETTPVPPGDYGYRQRPGEFANNGETYGELKEEYKNATLSMNETTYMNLIRSSICADFATLQSRYGSEWTITPSSATATVPSGYRKIAVIGYLERIGSICISDFHFYMRHSDGKWSHKPGSTAVTNRSFDTNVVITDSNIDTVIREGIYNTEPSYYLIKKSAVMDYPHQFGHNDNSLWTVTSFTETAGDTLEKSANLYTDYLSGKIDYPIDVDCFRFTSDSAGTYYFSAEATNSNCDLDIRIYNSQGVQIASDLSVGDPFVTTTLQANTVYYIKLYDSEENKSDYVLEYIH